MNKETISIFLTLVLPSLLCKKNYQNGCLTVFWTSNTKSTFYRMLVKNEFWTFITEMDGTTKKSHSHCPVPRNLFAAPPAGRCDTATRPSLIYNTYLTFFCPQKNGKMRIVFVWIGWVEADVFCMHLCQSISTFTHTHPVWFIG
jgi:hypothetical protein